jgi:hypothetical protein
MSRLLLAVLAASAAYVGLWAALAPRSFYDSFPGTGRHWVLVDGPFNEHLVRDVGGLYLALLVLSVGAILRADPSTTRLTGAAWLIFSAIHLAYHADHLQVYDGLDQVLNMVSLGGSAVLAAVLCLPHRRARRRSSSLGEVPPVGFEPTLPPF